MTDTYITKSFQETQAIAEKFSTLLKGGEVIALYGDLGSGKTTFAQGLARGLGIKSHINSPTFIILRTYKVPNLPIPRGQVLKSQIINYYHVDLYRTENEYDIEGLGLSDLLREQDSVTIIEWPEKMGKHLPEKRIAIQFEYIDETKRKITIKKF